MSDADELKRLREALSEIAEVMELHAAGAVSADYVVGWIAQTLRRMGEHS